MAAKTPTAPDNTLSGNPNKIIPVRTTTTSGKPEAVSEVRDQCRHIVLYFADVDNNDTYAHGKVIVSAAFATSSANTCDAKWDPDDATGTVTFQCSAVDQTGWLHIWDMG